MNITYEYKPQMTFIGFHTHILPQEGYQKCPEFWDSAYNEKYARLWQTMTPQSEEEQAILDNQIGLFAICEDGADGFNYWIVGLYRGGAVPQGMELFTFPESEWAVFSAKGPLPGSLQQLNTQVWQQWYPAAKNEYEGNGMSAVEVYSAGNPTSPDYECGMWIPVKKLK